MGVTRLKVIHIIPTGSWAGSERIAFGLATMQAKNSDQIYIAVRSNKNYPLAFYQEQAGKNVKVIDIPAKFKGAQAIADHIRQICCPADDAEFDIAHGHLGLGCRIAACFKDYSYTLGHMHVRFLTTQHQNLDGVVAVSEWQLKDIPQWYKGDVVVIPNFLNEIPELNTKHKLAFKRRYYLEETDFLFGIVCRLHIEIGVDLAIDEFNELNLPNAKLLIIGEGSYENYFKQLTTGNPKIIFAGFIKNASEYMRIFDCMISPSRADSFGMSVLESLFSEVPVISSSTYGAKDILKDDPLLFEIDDMQDLKAKMEMAYKGTKNKVDYSSYHANISVPKMEAFYRSIINRRINCTTIENVHN